MAACRFCGLSAGLFRRAHSKCRARHDIARAKIPEFFAHAMSSPIPLARFKELADELAKSSFIGPSQLLALGISGITAGLNGVIQERLVTEAEETRINELRAAFSIGAEEFSGIEDRLLKIAILRDLQAGLAPDRVELPDELPIRLGQKDKVLWIFNHVANYPVPQGRQTRASAPRMSADASVRYHAPETERRLRTGETAVIWSGDLLVATRGVYLISPDGIDPIPAARITSFDLYSDGIHIDFRNSGSQTRIVLLDDPWFAANLIEYIVRRVQTPRSARLDSEEQPPA
jgi:hypothetical protein